MAYNPYKIDGPALISFSGGRTSGFMLWNIIQAHGGILPEDYFVVFANTGKEVPETLDFIYEISQKWNIKIYWLELDIHNERPIYRTKEVDYKTASRNGEPFAALIDRKQMLPNPVMRICTAELKMGVITRFMRSKGHKSWSNVVGLRYDEPRRVANQRKANDQGKNKYFNYAPLFDDKKTVEDVSKFWIKSNFDLNLPNHNGRTLAGNCDLCYLKGTQTLVDILREKPELADWWIEQEQKIQKSKKAYGSNYDATFKKDRNYIKLLEISKNPQPKELFDDDSRSCFCHD
jgi:3'-phosphoadenosine 5'-phosphosulfate sulfotransferase (PAPS reductase)/FAD synthetase